MSSDTHSDGYSLIIRNARIIDGSGRPPFEGDVGVRGDRIAAVGVVTGSAAEEIDAEGQVLAPGFIDIHTHYDPQLCWDRVASPSPEHGVTSLVIGNCSISLAPVLPGDEKRVIHLFGSVEDMEGDLLERTVPFAWTSVPEYLDYLRDGLGPNVGMLVGHSMLRLFVMGEAAQERAATDDEVQRMCAVLGEAVDAGALGLSFTYTHLDEKGARLPCSYATRAEIAALMRVLVGRGRGVVEVSPQPLGGGDLFAQVDLFGSLALETGVTCTLSPVLQIPYAPGREAALVEAIAAWHTKGARLFAQTQTRPLDMTIRLDRGSPVLGKAATWRRIMDMPVRERVAAFSDPALRDTLYDEACEIVGTFDKIALRATDHDPSKPFVGLTLREIGERTGKRFTDAFIDIALKEDLATVFSLDNFVHADVGVVSRLLDDPVVHVGSGDAGAHITSFSGAGDTCYLIEKFVRAEGTMTLERAVQRLTSDIARDWGLTDRGEIATGKFADLVLFDPEKITRGEEIWVEDIPGGHGRYVRHPRGIDKVIVNGAVLVDGGEYTASRPGRVI